MTLVEGSGGTTDFVFTVTRSHNLNDTAVDVASADGSALAGSDYTALPLQTLLFPEGGVLSQTVTVAVTADLIEEAPAEGFFVDLSSAVGATVADGQGVGTILDDDDLGPPSVTLIDSVAGTGDGVLAECEEARVAMSRLLVVFDQPMFDPPGSSDGADVTNPANYRLFAAGADDDLGSVACTAAAGDDIAVQVAAVSFDAGGQAATLELGASSSPLADGPYRLVVCDSITDPAGGPLVGGDFVRTFRVERDNLLQNGHLDCDLAGWNPASTAPGEIVWSSDDVDAASISGSAAITNLTASTDFSLSQCVAVTVGESYALNGRIRLAALASVLLERSCRFFTAPACAGVPLVAAIDVLPLADTGGAWQPVTNTLVAPAGSASARCGFELTSPTGGAFSARLDDLELLQAGGGDLIFADGFESGDTSVWTLSVP